jgi:opacity protein-like surface antigen
VKTGKLMLAVVVVFAMPAHGQVRQDYTDRGQAYVGLNWFTGEFESTGGADFDIQSVYARGGYNLAEWAALEARVGMGTSDDSFNIGGVRADAELDYFIGGYFVAGIPTDSIFYPYAMVGYTRADVDVDLGEFSEDETESDLSFGIGTDVHFNDFLGLNVEYTRYLDKSDADVTGLTVGVKFSL